MQTLQLKSNKRAIVIVAHPDDEIIFMGGVIMKNPQVRWAVFSLCRASDKDRQPKFFRVCEKNNVKGVITDLEDENKLSIKETLPIIEKLLISKLSKKHFDYIFTHGANGEYGHPRHIGVHQVVAKLIKNKSLKPEAVFYFNYKKVNRTEFSPVTAKANSNCLLKLSRDELQTKRETVAYMYGYDIKGIDVGFAPPQAFIKIDIKK